MRSLTAHRTACHVFASEVRVGDVISWQGTRNRDDLTVVAVSPVGTSRVHIEYDTHPPVTVLLSAEFQVWR